MADTTKDRLWTPSFIILWQGQLVSMLGDAAYSIALGFWVLKITGSTALMGMLMAVSTLPGVLVSPFAGVLIDLKNKKHLLILMDMFRGLSIVLIAIAAFSGYLAIWMVFAAGIILSVCGAVFNPGVDSAMPDLVSKSKLTNANSLLALAGTGSSMVGSVLGGILFQAIGAPFLFLFNGLSFLFSGISIFFVKIPKRKINTEFKFWQDMRDGFKFMWKLKGLRYLLFLCAVLNFFAYIAIVLIMPFFEKTHGLGPAKYGIVMACYMAGAMAGFIFTSIITFPPRKRLVIFILFMFTCYLSLIAAIIMNLFVVMAALMVIGGFCNSVINVVLMSTIQLVTPENMRGKVMAFMRMSCQGLTPFAEAFGGVLGGIFPIRAVILAAMIASFLIAIPFYFKKSFKRFVNYDYEKDDLHELVKI